MRSRTYDRSRRPASTCQHAAMLLACALLAGCGPKEPTPTRQGAKPGSRSAPSAAAPRQTESAAQQAQRIAAAEAALKNQLLQVPSSMEARLALGNLYFDTDRPHRAVVEYQIVLKATPCAPNVRTDLGTCYKRMNQLDLARAEYEKVLKGHPKHFMATFNLGVVTELQGDRLGAAKLWERAAFLNPESRIAVAALKYAAAARKAAAATKAANAQPEAAPTKGGTGATSKDQD